MKTYKKMVAINSKQRIPYMDSVKGLCMLFIIMIHL